MNLWYAFFPVLGVIAFALVWARLLAFLKAKRPDWKRTPNFYSVALAVGITLFMTQTAGAFLLDPLALDKLQVSLLTGVFQASETCVELNATPVMSLACVQPPITNASYVGLGRIPYGENATCKCEWVTR